MLTSNIDKIKTAINFKLTDFLFLMCKGLSCLIFSFVIAWKIVIIFLGFVPLMIISTILTTRIVKKYTSKESIAYNKADVAHDVLSNIRTIISYGIQKKAISSYEKHLHEAELNEIKKSVYEGIFEAINYGKYYLLSIRHIYMYLILIITKLEIC